MMDKYTRRFLCYIRWGLYIAGILAIIKHYYDLSFFPFFIGFILLVNRYESAFFLAVRYKWYGFSCILYYVLVFICMINKSGHIFDNFSLFLLILFLPFIPQFVVIEIAEFRQSKGDF
jgi:hypothetical protein